MKKHIVSYFREKWLGFVMLGILMIILIIFFNSPTEICAERERQYAWSDWRTDPVPLGTDLDEARKIAGNASLFQHDFCVKTKTVKQWDTM
jgi:hypothetical protein